MNSIKEELVSHLVSCFSGFDLIEFLPPCKAKPPEEALKTEWTEEVVSKAKRLLRNYEPAYELCLEMLESCFEFLFRVLKATEKKNKASGEVSERLLPGLPDLKVRYASESGCFGIFFGKMFLGDASQIQESVFCKKQRKISNLETDSAIQV